MKVARYSIVPVIVAFAAFFAVLPPTGADATIRIIDQGDAWVFAPAAAQTPVGGRIAFRNESGQTHTATCGQPDCWDSGDIQPGETVFVETPREGAFAFFCRYHQDSPGLTGQLTVGAPEPVPSSSADPVPSPPA